MKGLRAGFKKGEAGALVVASAGPGGRGKATGREWSARGGGFEEALQGIPRQGICLRGGGGSHVRIGKCRLLGNGVKDLLGLRFPGMWFKAL